MNNTTPTIDEHWNQVRHAITQFLQHLDQIAYQTGSTQQAATTITQLGITIEQMLAMRELQHVDNTQQSHAEMGRQ